MLELYVAPQLEEFQTWIIFQQDGAPPYITNLKARITDAFATITADMLGNTWRETDYRLDVLCATKGAHVEVY
jgi:hypothetical protein